MRFQILQRTRLHDDDFASMVTMVCCGLHNLVERAGKLYELDNTALPPELMHYPDPQQGEIISAALCKREALANYVQQ